ncbi:MAG: Formamidopyrimidine-DNA glycosylase [Phycisphaerales bacterium]|nr:Formamidopyrimidine-DNA glycosylase [Phycisphaerales bacterium]
MPELPDVTVYVECLRHRVIGRELHRVRITSPFLLRTFEPPVESLEGRRVRAVTRLGKRIVLEFEGDLFAVIHLMIAGRFRWIELPTAAPSDGRRPAGRSKIELARFEFDHGVLVLTEASQKKRASLHAVAHRDQLSALAPAGLDVLTCTPDQFRDRLLAENRTLKRALTTPRLFDGIGNAYSDEILHAARLSPTQLTRNLDTSEIDRLHRAAAGTLARWIATLRSEFELDRGPGRFPGPGEITAFRPDFGVHGKFGKPCPICGTKVQRIVYAENECNYCPVCQTNGKVLADRSLSRLLKDDWPATVEEWE